MKLSDRVKDKLKKINISSLAFFAISMISITLAWFAYTNTVSSNMNIDLKAWNVKITKNNTEINNSFTINIADLYPGVSDFSETYTVHNTGDIAAKVSYNIKYFRLFDTEINTTNGISFAQLERDYPFKLSFTHESRYLAPGNTTNFSINCTWPLDSGNNELDTHYGNLAYQFYQSEQQLHNQNPSYQIRPGLELKIEIVVSQYIDETNSFSTDSWDTIELAVEKGDTSKYSVGNTKNISMDLDGNGTNETYVLRLVNKSSSSTICSGSTNSQTACGFVVEFADVIGKRRMNPTNTNFGYNVTELHNYINTVLEGKLPIDLQNVLAKTDVVSGYGTYPNNYVCSRGPEKLYLFAATELFGSNGTTVCGNLTRQLDYYTNHSKSKTYNGSSAYYWLRSIPSGFSDRFDGVTASGTLSYIYTDNNNGGYAPAFRIS